MTSKKDRRHSGRRVICVNDSEYPIQFDYYDDWSNWRDGMRDKEAYRIKNSWKTQKHEKIRKIKRIKQLKRLKLTKKTWLR